LLIFSPLVFRPFGKSFSSSWDFKAITRIKGAPAARADYPLHEQCPRVWIIFDALDYRTAFGAPHAGISLQELDRFSAESLTASHAYLRRVDPALIPSLTTGEIVTHARTVSPSELELTANGKKFEWSQVPTVFSEARELKHNVAVVGCIIPMKDSSKCVKLLRALRLSVCRTGRAQTFAGTMARELCAMVVL